MANERFLSHFVLQRSTNMKLSLRWASWQRANQYLDLRPWKVHQFPGCLNRLQHHSNTFWLEHKGRTVSMQRDGWEPQLSYFPHLPNPDHCLENILECRFPGTALHPQNQNVQEWVYKLYGGIHFRTSYFWSENLYKWFPWKKIHQGYLQVSKC